MFCKFYITKCSKLQLFLINLFHEGAYIAILFSFGPLCPDFTFFKGVLNKEFKLDARRTLFDNLTLKSYSTKIMGLAIKNNVNLELLTLKAYRRQLLNLLRQAIF